MGFLVQVVVALTVLLFVLGSRGRLARTRRYGQILAIRHGPGPYLGGSRRAGLDHPSGRARLARSLREALDEGGVTFVKVAQVLSRRRDLLPAEFVDELSGLQDRVAPAQCRWAGSTPPSARPCNASCSRWTAVIRSR